MFKAFCWWWIHFCNPILYQRLYITTWNKFKTVIKLLPKDRFLMTLNKFRLSLIITYLFKRFWVLMVFAIKFFIGELKPNILLFVYMSDLAIILETTKKITLKKLLKLQWGNRLFRDFIKPSKSSLKLNLSWKTLFLHDLS